MLDHFFSEKARILQSGDLQAAVALLKYPAAIYVQSELIVLKDEAKAFDVLKSYRAHLLEHGYARTSFQQTDSTCDPDGQSRHWISWTHWSKDGRVIKHVDTCHYCKTVDGQTKTTMVEVLAMQGDVVEAWASVS